MTTQAQTTSIRTEIAVEAPIERAWQRRHDLDL